MLRVAVQYIQVSNGGKDEVSYLMEDSEEEVEEDEETDGEDDSGSDEKWCLID